jgi:broad specificity phosphatase PhoE
MTPDDAITPEMLAMQRANQATQGPTRLYLMRHGEPEEAYANAYYGQMDVGLSERGRRQSAALAERLADVPLDAVYSSDLGRATYLARLLAEPRDLPTRALAAFRERHMGRLQGLTAEQMERDHAEEYARWRADRVHYRVPESENFDDLRDRVVPAMLELAASFAGRRVAVAAHAGPIRVMVAHVLGLALENIFRMAVNHCGLFVLEFSHEQPPRVTLMNG